MKNKRQYLTWFQVANVFCLAFLFSYIPSVIANDKTYFFTDADIDFLSQFSLSNLPTPTFTSNQFAYNVDAAKFGHRLFFDTDLSANKKISCAHCHQPKRYFADNLKVSKGVNDTIRNAPSLLGAGYGPWKYWDGRKDSLWSQALSPLEHPDEQAMDRNNITLIIKQKYSEQYRSIFGDFDQNNIDKTFSNIGKALMAYQLQLKINPSPFDQFIDILKNNEIKDKDKLKALKSILKPDQVNGLRLFVGKANCVSCHNGPLLSNFEFHNIGIPESREQVDLGRYDGIEKLRNDEFTCLSPWSDANPNDCIEMIYLKEKGQELVGAFKTPSLRNVAKTAPYMHAGQFATLEDVVSHYNKPTPPTFIRGQHPYRPHFDILPLNLSSEELDQIISFLHSLTSPIPKNNSWWERPL